ncbi:HET-domain-containing protein [Hypoxylon sp. FL1857]|nr:HET-domain-containing protein [Hypoxylon sp. FL1857]
MWLIDTTTFEQKLVREPAEIEYSYAILSHTWNDEELSYQDFQKPLQERAYMKGFGKIVGTCRLASERGLRSSELSEAINSMFRWYIESATCIVFLEDLPPQARVEFYDASWTYRGSKPELNTFLAGVTGIDLEVLTRRMSWASMRQTTRIEDKAYCLLGIFGVNMPMIYGEGAKASARLQEEIVKDTGDLSIFAWVDLPPGSSGADSWIQQSYRGIFARSPREFANCRQMRQRVKGVILNKEFTVTNKGLRIETALVDIPQASQDLILNLGISDNADRTMDDAGGWVGVYLAKTASGYDLRASESESIENRFRGAICVDFSRARCQIVSVMPLQLWDERRSLFLNVGEGINAYHLLRVQILVTCSTMFEPICAVWTEDHPFWNTLFQFMNGAKELSDYHPQSNLTINIQVAMKPHIAETQPCFRLELIIGESISNMDGLG